MANSKWATSLPTSQATQAPRGALLKTRRAVLWDCWTEACGLQLKFSEGFSRQGGFQQVWDTLMRPMLLPISMFQWKEQQNTPVGNAMFFPVVDLSGHVGTLIGNHDISCWNYNLYSVAFRLGVSTAAADYHIFNFPIPKSQRDPKGIGLLFCIHQA